MFGDLDLLARRHVVEKAENLGLCLRGRNLSGHVVTIVVGNRRELRLRWSPCAHVSELLHPSISIPVITTYPKGRDRSGVAAAACSTDACAGGAGAASRCA